MTDISFDIVTGTSLLEASRNFFTGNMNGLLVTVEYLQSRNQLEMRFGATGLSEDDMTQICQALRGFIDGRRTFLQIDDHSICVILHADRNWQDRFHKILEILDSINLDLSIRSGCFLCGNTDDDVQPHEIESLKAFLCQKCANSAKEELCKTLHQKSHDAKYTRYAKSDVSEPENFSLGMIGLLLGSVVGFILLFVLVIIPFGYFFAGAALAFCVMLAYTKGAGVLSIKGLIVCMVCISIILYIGVTVTSMPTIASELKTIDPDFIIENGKLFWTFPKYIFDPAFSESIVFNYIFAIVGSLVSLAYHIVQYMRKNA